MTQRKSPRKFSATTVSVVFLLALTVVFWGVSIFQRGTDFGVVTDGMAGYMTAGNVLAALHWYEEGPFQLRFCLYWDFPSIEAPTLESRDCYFSFPPGFAVPVYGMALLSGRDPSPALAALYNLFSQGCIAFLLGMTAFLCLRRMRYGHAVATGLSSVPIFLYIWLPSPFLEHRMALSTDQVVMLPYALCLFLELVRPLATSPRARNAVAIAQGCAIFFGVLTEWLFVFVVFFLYLIRLVKGALGWKPLTFLKRSALLGLPAVLPLLLFSLQLYHLDAFSTLYERFEARTGIDEGTEKPKLFGPKKDPEATGFKGMLHVSFDSIFWKNFIPNAYGKLARPLLLFSFVATVALCLFLLICRILHRPPGAGLADAATIMVLVLAPCLVYYQVFRDHCNLFLHFFTVLKFSLVLSLTPFVLAPAAALGIFHATDGEMAGARRVISFVLTPVLIAAAATYVYYQGDRLEPLFAPGDQYDLKMGDFLVEHTGYADIVFMPGHDRSSPQTTLACRRNIHGCRHIENIRKVVENVAGDYVVNLLATAPDAYAHVRGIAPLMARATESTEEDGFWLWKIPKAEVEAALAEAEVPKTGQANRQPSLAPRAKPSAMP